MIRHTEFVEIRLGNVPCWECGQPAYSFIPSRGVRHSNRWCWFAGAEDAWAQTASEPIIKAGRTAA